MKQPMIQIVISDDLRKKIKIMPYWAVHIMFRLLGYADETGVVRQVKTWEIANWCSLGKRSTARYLQSMARAGFVKKVWLTGMKNKPYDLHLLGVGFAAVDSDTNVVTDAQSRLAAKPSPVMAAPYVEAKASKNASVVVLAGGIRKLIVESFGIPESKILQIEKRFSPAYISEKYEYAKAVVPDSPFGPDRVFLDAVYNNRKLDAPKNLSAVDAESPKAPDPGSMEHVMALITVLDSGGSISSRDFDFLPSGAQSMCNRQELPAGSGNFQYFKTNKT